MTESMVRVAINQNFNIDGVDIMIGLRYDHEHAGILRFSELGFTTIERVEPMTRIEHPTMSLSDDFARALLDALLRYYQGASDTQTLRSDYLHERDRVDKMIGTFTTIMERIGQ